MELLGQFWFPPAHKAPKQMAGSLWFVLACLTAWRHDDHGDGCEELLGVVGCEAGLLLIQLSDPSAAHVGHLESRKFGSGFKSLQSVFSLQSETPTRPD